MKHGLALLLILLVSSQLGAAKVLKRDPETGLIRILYVGAPFWASPYQVFKYDPLLSTTPVAGNLYGIPSSQVKKAMRLYMPRTEAAMTSKYDIIGLDDCSEESFPRQVIHWMVESCTGEGMGIFMAGGFESFGGAAGFPSWGDTELDKVMPVKCTPAYGPDGKNVVTGLRNEFIKSVPWDGYDQHNIFGGYNIVLLKQGANQLSEVIRMTPGGGKDPGWVWWDVGSGRFFASAPGFRGGSADRGFIRWKHYQDFVSNMVYWLAGLKPPQDIELLYQTRQAFKDIYDQRQVVLGTIDFISGFGADTTKVDRKLAEAKEIEGQAKKYFVDLDLARSKEEARKALSILQQAYDLALEAKAEALYWIFVTEWLVVTATGLVCGFVVWTLMIRKRLYREVAVTRAGGL